MCDSRLRVHSEANGKTGVRIPGCLDFTGPNPWSDRSSSRDYSRITKIHRDLPTTHSGSYCSSPTHQQQTWRKLWHLGEGGWGTVRFPCDRHLRLRSVDVDQLKHVACWHIVPVPTTTLRAGIGVNTPDLGQPPVVPTDPQGALPHCAGAIGPGAEGNPDGSEDTLRRKLERCRWRRISS